MSEKKQAETTPVAETTPADETTPVNKVVDDGKVDLYIPRTGTHEEKQVVIGINGKNWVVPKGKHVRVPQFVADEYHRSIAASDLMYERKEEMAQEEPQDI